MEALLRTLGVSLLSTFAIPIAGMSGIAAVICLLILIFSSELRSFELFLFVCIASATCYFSFRYLLHVTKRGQLLVESINQKESLSLNNQNKLGYPGPTFLVFDKVNRKLAVCNYVTQDYKIYDFGYVLQWYYEWGVGTKMDIGITGGQFIQGTGMREPTLSQREYKKGFMLVLEVSDENNPILKFPMNGEASAKGWCAKLNAIFNG